MNLSSLKNIFRALLAKKEVKPSGSENMIDLADNQMVCNSGVCASGWKPFRIKTNYADNTEPKNQVNRMS